MAYRLVPGTPLRPPPQSRWTQHNPFGMRQNQFPVPGLDLSDGHVLSPLLPSALVCPLGRSDCQRHGVGTGGVLLRDWRPLAVRKQVGSDRSMVNAVPH